MKNQDSSTPSLKTGLKLWAMIGAIGSIVFLGGLLVWAQYTMISGAVVASGVVVVRGQPQSIQHLDGGIVEEILVSNGDIVAKNDVLIRLDDVLLRANLKIYKDRLAEAYARQARLRAEQAGLSEIEFDYVSPLIETNDQSLHKSGQKEIFIARQLIQSGRNEQLTEKIQQFRNQITGVEGQVNAKRDQLGFIEKELSNAVSLYEKGLTTEGQVLGLQRTKSDLLGQLSEHISELARIENSIRDTELEILQGSRQFKEQVVTELRDVSTRIGELEQQIISTQKQLDRVEIRSPAGGIVHEMQVVTIGGVVPPGGVVLQVIPRNDGVEFEVRVDPRSIDQVFAGQSARIRFPAFNHRSTPELVGSIKGISPTSITDPATGMRYYRVTLALPLQELQRLGDQVLVPGMPVETYLQTGDRSVLSYLVKPLADQIKHAFKEE